jgi:hypothetical protein
MFITDHDFLPFRIQDLGSRIKQQQKKRRWEFFCPFFYADKNFTKNLNIFIEKLLQSSQSMGLGSGIRKKLIPDHGVKKAPASGFDSATQFSTFLYRSSQIFIGFVCVSANGSFLNLMVSNRKQPSHRIICIKTTCPFLIFYYL